MTGSARRIGVRAHAAVTLTSLGRFPVAGGRLTEDGPLRCRGGVTAGRKGRMKEEEAAMPGDGRRAIVGARHGRRAACRLDRHVLSPHRALEGLTIGHLRMGAFTG